MSGAVINASQLTKLLNLDFNILTIVSMPKKERPKSADRRKWSFFSRLWGVVAQSLLWSIGFGLKMAGLGSVDVT